jgi:hypothetical protein
MPEMLAAAAHHYGSGNFFGGGKPPIRFAFHLHRTSSGFCTWLAPDAASVDAGPLRVDYGEHVVAVVTTTLSAETFWPHYFGPGWYSTPGPQWVVLQELMMLTNARSFSLPHTGTTSAWHQSFAFVDQVVT